MKPSLTGQRLKGNAAWKGTELDDSVQARMPAFFAATLLGSIPALAQVPAQPAAGGPTGGARRPRTPQTSPAKPQPPATQPPKNNPFETIPEAPEPAPPPRAPAPAGQPPSAQPRCKAHSAEINSPFEDVIESIEFRGVRRGSAGYLAGDDLHQTSAISWTTIPFTATSWLCGTPAASTISGWSAKPAKPAGFCASMAERRVIRTIKYDGNKSVTNSEILDRFKERKVGLSVESQYDPNKIQRARNVLQEYLAERGRRFATVDAAIAPGTSFLARSDVQGK